MSLSTVLFLFLAHLGVGIVLTLVFVSREAGVKFFRFNAGLAAILIGFAFVFRPTDEAGAVASVAFYALAAAEAALLLYWATIGRSLAANHYGAINIVTAVVAIALGLFAIWWAYQTAPKVGTSL